MKKDRTIEETKIFDEPMIIINNDEGYDKGTLLDLVLPILNGPDCIYTMQLYESEEFKEKVKEAKKEK